MIRIGKSFFERYDGWTRLCAPVLIDERELTIWYAVPKDQEDSLSSCGADPFVMLLLPAAMRSGNDLYAEDPMSERLCFQLENDLIPALCHAESLYHPICLHVPVAFKQFPAAKAVSTIFSNSADCLYTVYRHGTESEYPLTHLAVFNTGFYKKKDIENSFLVDCRRCSDYAKKLGLKTVFVDSNLSDVLQEKQTEVESFRLLSFALALQGLVSVFLVSAVYPYESFSIDARNVRLFDPLSVVCACTESTQFYLSGAETDLLIKQEEISRPEFSFSTGSSEGCQTE